MTTITVSREFLIEHLAHNAYGEYVFEEQYDGDYDPDALAEDFAQNGKTDDSGTDEYGGTPNIAVTLS